MKNNYSHPIEVSIVMPCLNEEETIGACVQKAFKAIQENGIAGEVIVADNGSIDKSVELAREEGAKVVLQREKGYGCAYQLGISEAKGKYIIIGDSDDTYNFLDIMKFVRPLREGYEFVNGSRIRGEIHNGAMPFLHRYLGNPTLSFILSIFFKSSFSDVYCGMKAFTKNAYEKIKPVSCGMEYALELIIRASGLNLKRTEVPVDLYLRKGESKLRTFRDGWRSLRFMLLYCPNYLFFVPGGLFFLTGFAGMCLLLNGPFIFLHHKFEFHAMIFSSMLVLSGFQLINLGFFAKTYALMEGFLTKSSFFFKFYKIFNLEKGILLGGLLIALGILIVLSIVKTWIFLGSIGQERKELFAFTIILIGIQVIFSSFLISLIGMKNKQR
ncbi:MAG: glycosyltransferase family 2 protein [Candidatus Omnitrophica bacterium]|nr:glycosyltransferase family 2 protein [Candidatus Omnitrophota bacterium]